MSNNIPTFTSLIKFSTPVLVSVQNKKSSENKQIIPINEEMRTEELLSQIIPPKEYILEHGQLWIQTVVSTPATKSQVIALEQELEKMIKQKQAKETGICSIREELYDQCFDELIRQITIDCKQRGLLLVKVRNEMRNILSGYKNLYESSIAYGLRKKINSDQKKTEMNNKISSLEKLIEELKISTDDKERKILQLKEQNEKQLELENQQHAQEIEKIKSQNNQIKSDLETILAK